MTLVLNMAELQLEVHHPSRIRAEGVRNSGSHLDGRRI
jgi:hypothetical protein